MNGDLEEMLAALAAGAADETETAALAGTLATNARARDAFARYRSAVECLALTAAGDTEKLDAGQKRRMLARIVAQAAAEPKAPASNYLSLVPKDRLLPYARGVEWAVIPGDGITIAFLIFDPSECDDVPLEIHGQDESGYVLEGSCTLWYHGGKRDDLITGDYYMVPGGKAHGAIFHERTVLFDVFSPNNADFERKYEKQRAMSMED